MNDRQSTRKIAFIADHDATIDEAVCDQTGVCEVIFRSVQVYRPTELQGDEEEAYASRLHPARLVLKGVTSLSCEGTWEGKNQLSDGEVLDAAGGTYRWERLLSEQVVKRVELSAFYGGRIIIEAESALLQLEGEGDEFERWSGPL